MAFLISIYKGGYMNLGGSMESIWQKEANIKSFDQLQGERKTDVLIIGGGITGILITYLLKQDGIDCILLEKGKLCQGTTSGTTAKITFQHGLIYQKILKKYGIYTVGEYLKANQQALKRLEKICRKINCDYEEKDNYVYSISNRKILENELYALEKIGYNAELCETLPLPIKTAGAVKFSHQAQFNPLKMITKISEDLPIYENSFVREISKNKAVTDTGSVTANHIVSATHFPFINKHGSYFLKLYQHRSYMIALDNAHDVGGMYVDESGTGFSFRNYKNYLLLGGGSHRTGKSGGNWTELRDFTKVHYPQSREVCAWAAQDCMSLDNIPYIGKYSKKTVNFWVATGFNKWGMTGAMLSAMILCDMIQERKNNYSEIFDPSRSILHPQLFINGFEAVKNLMTFTGKRCPHLGCALKWNSDEHSWDCACHGSRFDNEGNVLDNPANGNIQIS